MNHATKHTIYCDTIFEHFKFEMNLLLREAFLESKATKIDAQNINYDRKICAAVSGGSDSISLLLMANRFARETGRKLFCVTVDHRLRPESAAEAEFVAELCRKLSIEHRTLVWADSDKVGSAGKLEAAARNARYSLMRDFCEKNRINILLLGHTLDDQMETFLLRKESGSSNIGLAGMSKIRRLLYQRNTNFKDLFILRPIMPFRKGDLRKFLNENEMEWKNDPMNDDPKFRRVSCRKAIMDYTNEEVAELTDKIQELGISRRSTESHAVEFLKNSKCCKFSNYGYVDISFSEFVNLEAVIQCEILRRILWDIGGKSYPPNISQNTLQNILAGSLKTLANCLIKISISRNFLRITRERRNLDQNRTIRGSGMCVLNNFLIKIEKQLQKPNDNKSEYVVSCSCDSAVYPGLSKEICVVLPCVRYENKVIFAYGSQQNIAEPCPAKVKCTFLHRDDLFDIFM